MRLVVQLPPGLWAAASAWWDRGLLAL